MYITRYNADLYSIIFLIFEHTRAIIVLIGYPHKGIGHVLQQLMRVMKEAHFVPLLQAAQNSNGESSNNQELFEGVGEMKSNHVAQLSG